MPDRFDLLEDWCRRHPVAGSAVMVGMAGLIIAGMYAALYICTLVAA